METELCFIAKKYNVDKCPFIQAKYPTHTYTPQYYNLLKSFKNESLEFLEIGIGNVPLMSTIIDNYIPGASMRMWRDFFQNANIYAADIDTSVLFEEDRIKSFYVDQNDYDSLIKLQNTISSISGKKEFDIILDDGSHNPDHQSMSFKALWQFIKKDGIYIIEDVHNNYFNRIINLPREFGYNDAEILYIHKGAWDSDNFIAFKKR